MDVSQYDVNRKSEIGMTNSVFIIGPHLAVTVYIPTRTFLNIPMCNTAIYKRLLMKLLLCSRRRLSNVHVQRSHKTAIYYDCSFYENTGHQYNK